MSKGPGKSKTGQNVILGQHGEKMMGLIVDFNLFENLQNN